jgi:hypothetical protein
MEERTQPRGEASRNSCLRFATSYLFQPLLGRCPVNRDLQLLRGPIRHTDLLDTHVWSDGSVRRFRQDAKTLTLRHCVRCGRDFAMGLDGEHWQAVYIGVFRVEPLHENVSERWLREGCPMSPIEDDDDYRGRVRQ